MGVGKQQLIPFLARIEEKNWTDSPHLDFGYPGEEDEVSDMAILCCHGVLFCISEALSLWDGSL